MDLDPLPAPAAKQAPTLTYARAHYEAVLALFQRRSSTVGPLVAMQEAMEAHDAERQRARDAVIRRAARDRAGKQRQREAERR